MTKLGCILLRIHAHFDKLPKITTQSEVELMFEKNLSVEQQSYFLGLVKKVVMADGKITESESQKMCLFASVFPGISSKECPLDHLKDIFSTQESRASVILELISVAMADGHIGKPEAALLQELAQHLSIPDNELKKMNTWVEKMLDLVRESQTFMGK